MRVNEENFVTGDAEDVEPSYVEVVVYNHNQDEGAHPDIRKQIAETKAFYQGVKDSVQGTAEAAQSAANDAVDSAKVASGAAAAAVSAKDAALQAEDAVKIYYPQVINGEWFLFSEEEGRLVPSGIMAKGKTPEKGTDYWTDEDKAEMVADVLAALPPIIFATVENNSLVLAQDTEGIDYPAAEEVAY